MTDTRLHIPVKVADTWETVTITSQASATVRAIKEEALERALVGKDVADRYEVKHRGAVVADERQTLEQLGVRSGQPLIVLANRRRPVV